MNTILYNLNNFAIFRFSFIAFKINESVDQIDAQYYIIIKDILISISYNLYLTIMPGNQLQQQTTIIGIELDVYI